MRNNIYCANHSAYVMFDENSNDILELDGFVVEITDSNSLNIKLKKGGKSKMSKEELEYRIKIYKEDLAEAEAARDKIENENVSEKVEAKLNEVRQEIADKLYAEHNDALKSANEDIERMKKVITRRENELAELVAIEEVTIEENFTEGV